MKDQVRGPGLVQSTDVIALLIFVAVQWRITVLWLRFARRFSAPAAMAARAGIVLLDAAVALGWLFDLLTFLGHPPVTGLSPFLYSAGILAYCLTATAVLGVRAAFHAVGKALGAEFHPGRRRALKAAGNLAVAAPFAAMGYGSLIERLDFRVREIDVPIPGLPADLDGLRLLHLSDIHLSAFLSEAQLARVVVAANGLRPHLAAVTGDLISLRGDPIDACIRQLARLRTDAPVVACMGNHEVFAGVEDYAAAAGALVGISFLRGRSRPLRFGNATLHVAGVDYQPIFQRAKYLRGAERLVAPGEINLLLSHNPDVFPVAARQGYNLMLSGHTHGG
jgi:hypothetical protein